MFSRNSKHFSIDDAFEEEFNEARRVYNTTTTPIKSHANGSTLLTPQSNVAAAAAAHAAAASGDQSRDSDSLIHGFSDPLSLGDSAASATTATMTDSCFQHPRVRRNWRMILAAFLLLLVGTVLLVLGVLAIFKPDLNIQATVFVLAGLICFIPGAYHVIYVFLAARGYRGYHFHNLPLFS